MPLLGVDDTLNSHQNVQMYEVFSPGIMGFLESMIDDNGLDSFSALLSYAYSDLDFKEVHWK